MGIKSKLQDWVDDGLITVDQSQSIQNFEKQRLSSKLNNGLKYTGFFAILLGIALIIASNWDALGMHFKLIAHVGVNALLAGLIWVWRDNQKRKLWREFAVYFLSGLTLTLLALIGQSFQLQGDISGLLLLWMVLITGFIVIVGHNTRIVSLWFIGFFVTLFYNIGKLDDIMSEHTAFFAVLSMSLFIPLGGYVIGAYQKFKDLNPVFAARLQNASIATSVIIAAFSSLVFYAPSREFSFIGNMGKGSYYLWLSEITILYIVLGLLAITARKNDDTLKTILFSGIVTIIPLFLTINNDILGAVYFIAYMVGLAFLAARGGRETMLGLCMFAISIRIFIIFIELFGSMFATGGGLILAGILLLGILKGTNIIRKKIIGGTYAS